MSTSKRVVLVVLCLIVVGSPVAVLAAGGAHGTARLGPVGDEPGVSGSAKLQCTGVADYPWPAGPSYLGTMSVSCTGLIPGRTYQGGLGSTVGGGRTSLVGTADQRGRLAMQSDWGWSAWQSDLPPSVTVYRVDLGGNVPVLSGTIHWNR